MRNNDSVTRNAWTSRDIVSPSETTNLADLLERVLDRGIVIARDVTLLLGGVQLLTLKIRLLLASIDKAQEIGINWWQFDPALSSRASARAKNLEQAEQERTLLKERLDRLERMLRAPPGEADQKCCEAGQRSNAAAAYVLDPEGRVSTELQQLAQRPLQQQEEVPPRALEREAQSVQQPLEEERPQTPEGAEEPESVQTQQPAGGALLLSPALHECMAQAIRPVLEGLRQRNAQASQLVEQGRLEGQQQRSNSRHAPVTWSCRRLRQTAPDSRWSPSTTTTGSGNQSVTVRWTLSGSSTK